MSAFIAAVRALSRACGAVAVALLVAAVLVVCQMVVMRYFLRASTVWQTEFVTFALIAATFVGAPYVLLLRGHVNVDLLPLYLGQRGRMALAYLASLAGLLFALIATWAGAILWWEAWEGGWRTDTVWALPLWIPYAPMPIGFAILALQYLADLAALASGRELPFGLRPEDRP